MTGVTARADDAPARTDDGAAPTRDRIVDAALRLFRAEGYEGTTMRKVAAEAGVSLGSAYHYFSGKEELVQAFYGETYLDHAEAVRPLLDTETSFDARLRGVLHLRVETMEPYREFAGAFFRFAADPRSPLSPFSADSAPARDAAEEIYGEVLRHSDLDVDPELAPELPRLLWLYSMGVVLFWVHDSSPDAERTHLLVDRTCDLVVRLLAASRLRVLRPVTRQVVDLVHELGGDEPHVPRRGVLRRRRTQD